jgi:pimeloyl-ACP methyl ester carboxylesterase
MDSFKATDGVEIAYHRWGEPSGAAPPVVLHHGFVANAQANWALTGVVEALVSAGHSVVAPDARGHGDSGKPHDPARYGEPRMAEDLGTLLDVLDLEQIDLVGYSMGAIVSLLFASADERVRRLVVGGVGSAVVEAGGVDRRNVSVDSIIEALTVEDPASIQEAVPSAFRAFADALGNDRDALVAQARGVFRGDVALARISAPTLVLAGTEDPLAVRPQVLAEALPDGRLELVAGDHMQAVVDPRFAQAIVDFLA